MRSHSSTEGMVFSQLLGLFNHCNVRKDCDTMVQREEIPDVWRAASLSTLGIHANWPGGILVSQPRRGAYRDKWRGSPLSQLHCVSLYKVDPRSYSWNFERHIHTTGVLLLEHTKCVSCYLRMEILIVYEDAVFPSSAEGSIIPHSLPFLPFSEIGLCIKCHYRWIFLFVTLFSIIPINRIRIG